MILISSEKFVNIGNCRLMWLIGALAVALISPVNIFSDNRDRKPVRPSVNPDRSVVLPDTIPVGSPLASPSSVIGESFIISGDSMLITGADTVGVAGVHLPQMRIFNPDPQRAVWLSALCPGLGQIYNRRYWKLPIVVGAYVGLGYATSWNNGMLRDYTRAYADLLDNDPNTKSYMDFFPSTTKEEDLNISWLTNTFKSRKDYYRRNRDLCIICMVGVYILAMVDAYVDATMTHFDISPDLSMQMGPAVIPDTRSNIPGIGVQWALTF